MKDFIEKPLFIIKTWEQNLGFSRLPNSPKLIHKVVYSENELINELRQIKGNYFIFNVGEKYEDKTYFDNIFLEERLKKEREQYEKLKQKFENDEKTT